MKSAPLGLVQRRATCGSQARAEGGDITVSMRAVKPGLKAKLAFAPLRLDTCSGRRGCQEDGLGKHTCATSGCKTSAATDTWRWSFGSRSNAVRPKLPETLH